MFPHSTHARPSPSVRPPDLCFSSTTVNRSPPDHDTMGEEGNDSVGPTTKPDVSSRGVSRSSSSGASQARRLARSNDLNNSDAGPSRSSSRSGQQPAQAKNFEFVLVTDNESRRQVRRHAMRQYMHQRRLDSIARLGPSRAPVGGWTTRPTSHSQSAGQPSSKGEDVRDESQEDDRDVVIVKRESADPPIVVKKNVRPQVISKQRIKSEDGQLLPLSETKSSAAQVCCSDGGSKDPFCSYPITISNADHQLIQHCKCLTPDAFNCLRWREA